LGSRTTIAFDRFLVVPWKTGAVFIYDAEVEVRLGVSFLCREAIPVLLGNFVLGEIRLHHGQRPGARDLVVNFQSQ
jgi:hypothetical protein